MLGKKNISQSVTFLLLKKSILLSTSLSYKNEFYEDDLEPLSSQKHKSRFRKFFFLV